MRGELSSSPLTRCAPSGFLPIVAMIGFVVWTVTKVCESVRRDDHYPSGPDTSLPPGIERLICPLIRPWASRGRPTTPYRSPG